MIIGYARISHKSQEIGTQVEQLKAEGCDRIIEEVITGVAENKKLNELVNQLTEGDVLVATRVDRLGRSAVQILSLADQLKKKNIHLKIIDLGVDTRTLAGQMVLGVMSQIAEFERLQDKEKQRRGIELARKRGTHLGRKASGYTKAGMGKAIQRYLKGESVNVICHEYNIPRSSFYAKIKEAGIKR